jgi:hypothetical protein
MYDVVNKRTLSHNHFGVAILHYTLKFLLKKVLVATCEYYLVIGIAAILSYRGYLQPLYETLTRV